MSRAVAIFDYPAETQAFVERGLWGAERQFGACSAIGFATAKEGLVAGFVYHNWEPDARTIELSGYSTRRDWATPKAIALIFGEYPFRQLNCRLLVARHSERNRRVRRIWTALGAKEYLISELRGPGEAEAVAVLDADVFLNSRFMR